uniref:Uncharacterized protein n=1 Tax=Moniliophthora roreri TaxID=221103 RepID=A0A0W0FVV6_MONRR
MRLWTIRNAHVLVALYPILLEIIYAFVLKRRTNITRELRVFSTTYTTIVVAVLFHVYLTFVVKRLARKSIALRHEVEIAVSSRTPKEAYAKCSALYLHQALAVATVVNMAVFTRDDTGPLIKGSIERLQSIVLDAFFSGIYWCIALGVVYGIARVYGLFPGWDTLVIGYVWLVVQILQIAQKYSSNIVNTILFILFLYFYPFTFLSTQEIVMWILVHVSDVLTGLYAYNTIRTHDVPDPAPHQDNNAAVPTDTRWLVIGIVVTTGMSFYTRKDGTLLWGTVTKLWEMAGYGAQLSSALYLPLLVALSHVEQFMETEAQGNVEEGGIVLGSTEQPKDEAQLAETV